MKRDFPSAPPATDLDLRDPQIEDQLQSSIQRLGYRFEMERRDFFKLLGGGVLICLCAAPALAQESGARARPSSEEELPTSIDAWLHIGEDGVATVYTGKVEVGQNIRTSLSQQVAEELRVPLASVRLVMGDTDLTPFDMGTFGSRTTPTMAPQLRRVAATARGVLVEMAAQTWKVDAASLTVAEGKITDPSGHRSIAFGELTKGQRVTKVISTTLALTPAEKWKVAGTSPAKIDGQTFVTGQHRYTSDMTQPEMLHGKILRPTTFRANLTSLDTSAAEKLPGVTVVKDGDFIGVAAPSQPAAAQAIEAIHAQWNAPAQPSEAELYEYLKAHPSATPEGSGRSMKDDAGSLEQGYAKAEKTLEQTYTVAYIAHVPLEPRAALAEWKDGRLTVWTGTQRPFAVRDELAQAFRLPAEKVRVIVPDTGSAYGGKHTGEAAVEAARLAKAADKPVKLVWSREEEFTWAYFRPAGVIEVKGGVRSDGTITAWEFDNYNSGPAAMGVPYEFPNRRIEFHSADSPLRQGSYRALAATANHFARESFIDELAHSVNMDGLQLRLKNLANERLKAVFQAAAEKFDWGKEKSSATRGFGIAGGIEKNGHIASCAEVEVDPDSGQVSIRRIVAAFDCGAVVNPEGLKNLISGAVVQGIGGALFEDIHFANGKITNPHMAQYRVPRFSDLPQIEVELVDRKDQLSMGAGETPIVGVAPAVGNAIFAATGIRLRALPMVPNGLPKQGGAKG